jgi:hypothetical protein
MNPPQIIRKNIIQKLLGLTDDMLIQDVDDDAQPLIENATYDLDDS